jgi:AcrR family transcriptional regulator
MSTAAALPTRAKLLVAAREVVEEGGYGAASVLAIAERAGVAGGTLYRHFASKQELFVELFREVSGGEERAMLNAWEAGAGTPAIDRLEQVLATFARRALRNPQLAWALLAEPVDPLVDAERLAYRARYTALVDAGEIPRQDVSFTAAAVVGGCGEALVGPLSPVVGTARPCEHQTVGALCAFVRRAVGAVMTETRRATT